MLYDKRWDRTETKPDVFSLESLIAWLEKQPATSKYDFWCLECCLGRYFIDAGFDLVMIGTWSFTLAIGQRFLLPPHFNWIAQSGSNTYGAALERARTALRNGTT